MIRVKKLVLLTRWHFTERDCARFGLEILRKNGFDVEVWDLTSLFGFSTGAISAAVLGATPYRRFHRYEEASTAVRALEPGTFILSLFIYHYGAIRLFRCISRSGLPFGVMDTNAVPDERPWRSLVKTAFRPHRLLKYLARRVPPRWLGINTAELWIAGGRSSLSRAPLLGPDTAILWAHTFDYDIYLEQRSQPVTVDGKMAVFIDQYLPSHPDFARLGLSPACTPDEYYPRMRDFFCTLETQLDVEVVIAAHPAADYPPDCQFFGGRRIVKGKTAELIRRSAFAITHSSTAISLVVLYEKPLLLVTTDKLQAHPTESRLVNGMARQLRKQPINVDDRREVDWKAELRVDAEVYEIYREAYIKTRDSSDDFCWEIVSGYFKPAR